MRTCTLCSHPAREEINRALITNTPYRSVAKRFNISETATFRHRQHMPAVLMKAHEAEEITEADSLIEELRDLATKARAQMAKAEESDDIRTALIGLREIARVLEFKARVAGEISAAQVEIKIAAISMDQLTDDQVDELHRKLNARRLERVIPPQEQTAIQARIGDAIIDKVLADPVRRAELQVRLAGGCNT